MSPYVLAPRPTAEALAHIARLAQVPVWLPAPLPTGWLVTGLAHAGDERTGARATLLACSGPAPLGGLGDMVLVAEEPGIGLGARYAGLTEPDPGTDVTDSTPYAKVVAAGHPTPLWSVPAPDRASFVGAAKGLWLWTVLWPTDAGLLLLENLELRDVREGVPEEAVVFGAQSPRLVDPTAG